MSFCYYAYEPVFKKNNTNKETAVVWGFLDKSSTKLLLFCSSSIVSPTHCFLIIDTNTHTNINLCILPTDHLKKKWVMSKKLRDSISPCLLCSAWTQPTWSSHYPVLSFLLARVGLHTTLCQTTELIWLLWLENKGADWAWLFQRKSGARVFRTLSLNCLLYCVWELWEMDLTKKRLIFE